MPTTSRFRRRLGALVASVALALVGTMLVQPPANAATLDWQTIYKTVRNLKAQACRTGTFTHPDGHKLKALRWRSNAVQAKLGGSVHRQRPLRGLVLRLALGACQQRVVDEDDQLPGE